MGCCDHAGVGESALGNHCLVATCSRHVFHSLHLCIDPPSFCLLAHRFSITSEMTAGERLACSISRRPHQQVRSLGQGAAGVLQRRGCRQWYTVHDGRGTCTTPHPMSVLRHTTCLRRSQVAFGRSRARFG